MKLPKDITTLVVVFFVLFILIKGFNFGEFLGNIF
jgi:hypothetical protein